MRDYVELVRQIEGVYPLAAGGASRDEVLRSSLVPYFNTLCKEIEREQRWSGAYTAELIVTASGTAVYAMPAGMLAIDRVYYVDATTGQVTTLDLFDPQELRRVYGDIAAPLGKPTKYAFIPYKALAVTAYSPPGTAIQFFPEPDGIYNIVVEGYQALIPIGETSGTTTAASTTLTVPSTAYLTDIGVGPIGTSLSVRGAGNLGVAGAAATHITSWTLASATQYTMGVAAVTAVAALGAQCFFNSQNWLLRDFDKVALFGVLRMVATYLRDDAGYVMYEQRFQHEMELMRGYEFDKSRTQQVFAVGVSGQNQSELRRQDQIAGLDIRGR